MPMFYELLSVEGLLSDHYVTAAVYRQTEPPIGTVKEKVKLQTAKSKLWYATSQNELIVKDYSSGSLKVGCLGFGVQ